MSPAFTNQARLAGIALAAVLAFTTFAPDEAQAQARNTRVNCTVDSMGNITVNFEIRGVGNTDLCVVAEGTSIAQCICQSNSGNCPAAANKRQLEDVVQDSDTFDPTNGRIQGQLFLPGASCAEADVQCGAGQTTLLAAGGFEDIELAVYEDFDETAEGCDPTGAAIRTGTCRDTFQTFNRQCAARFG